MDGITCGTGLCKWVGEEIRSSVNSPARPRLAPGPSDSHEDCTPTHVHRPFIH